VWTISYEDRFGPLGVISVLAGVRAEQEIQVDAWVLSCRAFSRAIEHHVLSLLGEDVDRVVFDFAPTERNGVTRSFLEQVISADGEAGGQLDYGLLRTHAMIGIHTVDREIDQ
jgi:predicted enzyme involved in methoxymalonyl-ACP biosynthesis